MIRRVVLVALVSSGLLLAQSAQQPRLTVHTQVREDIFAGYMADDMERFEIGVKKLDAMLRENAENVHALSWAGSSELFRAIKAHEAGKQADFRTLYAGGKNKMERALALAPKDGGVLAVLGASLILFGDRLPQPERTEAYTKGRALFKELASMQQPTIDRLPVHLRGELLAGLAQSAQRLGDWEDAKTYLNQIVAGMAGTPYERKAKRWLDEPASAEKSALVCQTCHEPGRLENVLRAQKPQP
jgi:hypothetical protein